MKQPAGKLRQRGSTLLVALLTTATLSIVVGGCLVSLTSRSQTAARSAAWQQAGFTAESAGDLAVAEIRRVLPDLGSTPADAWNGWTAWIPSDTSRPLVRDKRADLPGKAIPGNMTLKLVAPVLAQSGQSLAAATGAIEIDAPADLKDSNNRQWLRVRAKGTSQVPGWRQASRSKLDNDLRFIAFKDKATGALLSQPQTSRIIELIVRPVPLFGGAILSAGAIAMDNSRALVDSYDSTDAQKSSSGEYDSSRRQRNGHVFTNGDQLDFRGDVYGKVGSNGATLHSSIDVTGAISNNFYQRLVPIPTPTWTSYPVSPSTVSSGNSVSVNATSASSAYRYKLANIHGDLTISGTTGSSVEIWVTGDITGSIQVNNGVRVTIYVAGNVYMDGDDLDNRSRRAANLKIYGIQPPEGENRYIFFGNGGDHDDDIYASIYAPAHALRLYSGGDLMGSFTVKSIWSTSKMYIHFDEALMKDKGPVGDYKVASWVEELP
jgi:type II secretory pathway pseudopilin PulG